MRENNIFDLLKQISENKREMNAIVQDIAQMRRDYDAAVATLKEQYNLICCETGKIGATTVSVRLGDLFDEICWLSGSKIEDLQFSLYSNSSLIGECDIDDFIRYNGNSSKFLMRFNLSKSVPIFEDEYSFNYFMSLSMDLTSVQADGKTLYDHCSAIVKENRNKEKCTELVVDIDIENVIIDISLNYLSLDTNSSCRPADLFMQAVVNCEERKYNSRVDKIRQRIKDN